MKLTYLGTAAAEGLPALFCQCDNCRRARQLGGKNIRTRSQALVDDTLLIDLPPDTFLHQLYGGLRTDKIKSCIITHSHSDHLYAPDLEMRKKNFAILQDEFPFTIYADESGYEMIQTMAERCNVTQDRVKPVRIFPGEAFEVEGYRVLPIRARHSPKTSPVVFVVEKDGKSLGYFHDTSALFDSGWEQLAQLEHPLALASLDCTEGTLPVNYIGHMNVALCVEFRDKLLSIGAADENTIFVLNHFSHNGENTLYDDLAPIAEKKGFLVSYDGLELTF